MQIFSFHLLVLIYTSLWAAGYPNQDLIKKYVTAKVEEGSRKYVLAASERLIELGNELHDVRSVLQPEQPQGVRPALKVLGQSLKQWVRKQKNS